MYELFLLSCSLLPFSGVHVSLTYLLRSGTTPIYSLLYIFYLTVQLTLSRFYHTRLRVSLLTIPLYLYYLL
jgi:hypothetical protein